jgi:uncharacterized membrane protein YgcG
MFGVKIKTIKRCVGSLLILGLLVGISSVSGSSVTEGWRKENFPNPQSDLGDRRTAETRRVCGRGLHKSNICDPDNMLTAEEGDAIEGRLNFIHEEHTTPCGTEPRGVQMSVALMKNMDTKGGLDSAEVFARYLHHKWGIGYSECDNGIMLLVAVENREVYISTGKGARKVVTDEAVQTIIENMRSHLRNEKYGQAVLGAVGDVHLQLAGKLPERSSSWRPFIFLGSVISGAVGLFYWRSAIDRRDKNRRLAQYKKENAEYENVKTKLTAIQDEVKAMKKAKAESLAEKFAAVSCPICLENFDTEDTNDAEVRTLDCGHQFCFPCIEEWLKNNKTCPICIADVPEDSDREAHFRLSSLREQHPNFVSNEAVTCWSSRNYRSRYYTSSLFQNHRPVYIVSPSYRGSSSSSSSSFMRSSSRSSNFSFGGGSSSRGGGGGGGGGSW